MWIAPTASRENVLRLRIAPVLHYGRGLSAVHVSTKFASPTPLRPRTSGSRDASAGSYALGMREDENVAWDEALDWEAVGEEGGATAFAAPATASGGTPSSIVRGRALDSCPRPRQLGSRDPPLF